MIYGSWDEWRKRVKDNCGANVRIDGEPCLDSEWMSIHLEQSGKTPTTSPPSKQDVERVSADRLDTKG